MDTPRGTKNAKRARRGTRRRHTALIMGVGLSLTLLAGACGGGGGATSSTAPTTTAAPTTPSPTPSTAPSPTETMSHDGRVDLADPTFSDPTNITNPLFPIVDVIQALQLGAEAGDTLRHEITLLPETKVIEWNGQQVETVVSQFVAYVNGRIREVATDYFAQADDGSVWYFGEQVDNYENGVIADNDGTWLAGKDGPAGMIMPADPHLGDVYRPENIPGFVFEEVTVQAVEETVRGPRGPVEGAIVVEEVLMDGTLEDKMFAPGYGEFQAHVATEDELVTVALAVPIDAISGTPPAELTVLSTGAVDVFAAAPSGSWGGITTTLESLTAAWAALPAGDLPPLLVGQMTDAMDAVIAAVEAQSAAGARQAALAMAHAALDLQAQYLSPGEIDLARFGLWTRRVMADAGADRAAGVTGDISILEAIWRRVGHTVDAATAGSIEAQLEQLRTAADGEDLTSASDGASTLLEALGGLQSA